jgi:hypothetical protein
MDVYCIKKSSVKVCFFSEFTCLHLVYRLTVHIFVFSQLGSGVSMFIQFTEPSGN